LIGRNRNPSLSRYDSVLINRLRIGHTRLTNSYLLEGENQPECQICHSPLTLKYIFIYCTSFGAARQRYPILHTVLIQLCCHYHHLHFSDFFFLDIIIFCHIFTSIHDQLIGGHILYTRMLSDMHVL